MINSSKAPNGTCPFLGLNDDDSSHMAFTSPENFCHQCKPPVSITLEHQNDFCLDANFLNCPVYQSGAGKRMPANLVFDRRLYATRSAPFDRRILWMGMIFAVVFVLVVVASFFFSKKNAAPAVDEPSINAVQSLTAIANSAISTATIQSGAINTAVPALETDTPSSLVTETVSPFPSLTSTLPASTPTIAATDPSSPAPTLTQTQIPPHSLEVPIGSGQQYIIHRVADGENLTTLVDTYQTSLEAIQAVNATLIIPIRIDAVLIIPLNIKDVKGLPKLEPFQVTQDQTTPEALAELLKTDAALFKSLNGFTDGESITKGSWVIIPR